MLIAGEELHSLIEQGVITAKHENVNAASIDVRLGNDFLFEVPPVNRDLNVVDLSAKESVPMKTHRIEDGGSLYLAPGDFCLACTMERFNMPEDISAQFILRSSMARNGLEHMQAGWADAGWHGSVLTLELANMLRHTLLMLRPGMRIGQMIFFRHAPAGENSYAKKGNYNNDATVTRGFK